MFKSYIEESYFIFVEDENGMWWNNKNRLALRWEKPVNFEVVQTLCKVINLKVSYVNIDKKVFSNWI